MQVKLFWVNSPWEDSGFVIEHSGGNARAGEAEINDWLAGIRISTSSTSSSLYVAMPVSFQEYQRGLFLFGIRPAQNHPLDSIIVKL